MPHGASAKLQQLLGMRYRAQCWSNAGRATWPGARARAGARVCVCVCVCVCRWGHGRARRRAPGPSAIIHDYNLPRPRNCGQQLAHELCDLGRQPAPGQNYGGPARSVKTPCVLLCERRDIVQDLRRRAHEAAQQCLAGIGQLETSMAARSTCAPGLAKAAARSCSVLRHAPQIGQYQQGCCAICHGNAP